MEKHPTWNHTPVTQSHGLLYPQKLGQLALPSATSVSWVIIGIWLIANLFNQPPWSSEACFTQVTIRTYIYICVYTCAYVCVYMRVHIYIYIHRERDIIYIHIYTYISYIYILCTVCMYYIIHIHICTNMYNNVCIYNICVHITVCVCADMQQNSVVSIATLSARLVKNFLPQNRKDVRLKSSRGQDLCQSPYTGLLMEIHMIVHMNVYDQAV